jgi:hypothetical protein
MLEFASNTTVEITVPHSYNDTALTLTNMQYEVLDADSTVLVAKTDVSGFNGALTETVVTISASANTTTAKRDVRLLNCYLVAASGEYIVSQVYMLKGNQLVLTPLTDSFMTFPDSLLTRARMAEDQEYFDSLTDELKAVSLEEAFNRMVKLKFKVGDTVITDIKSLTVNDYQALSSDFLLALKKAQVAEANAIVENSPIRDKIRSGIISETIGESSMFFTRSMPSGKFHGLSDDAYEYIKPWVYRDVSSAQTWTLGRA